MEKTNGSIVFPFRTGYDAVKEIKGGDNDEEMAEFTACLLIVCSCMPVLAEEAQPERTPASYIYALEDGGEAYVENLIFNEKVIVSGENAQIIFVNCECNADLVLTAEQGTRVLLLGCDVNGQTYSMADCEFFSDLTAPESGLVAYEGQEASYYCIARWQENGQPMQMVICELDPSM